MLQSSGILARTKSNRAGERGIANKLSELLDAIKECREETSENTRLPVDQQLRDLFPSTGRSNRSPVAVPSGHSSSSSSTSDSCQLGATAQSTSQTIQSVKDSKPDSRGKGIENFLRNSSQVSSSRGKRKKVKTSTVTCLLKDIYFLTSKTDQVQCYISISD